MTELQLRLFQRDALLIAQLKQFSPLPLFYLKEQI